MLTLRLLGGLALEVQGAPVSAPSGRCGSLLAWLALHPGLQPRSRVASRMWPDVLDESARRSLRTALFDLRRDLAPEADGYLHATRDEIGLWPPDEVRVDVRAFAAAVAEGRLEQALVLGDGELLPEFEHDWVHDARVAHRQEVDRVIARIALDAENAGDMAGAIGYTRRLTALDPLAEEHARQLIRRLAAAGDRAAALAAYDRHRRRLRSELQLAPSAATRALVEQIRTQVDAGMPPSIQTAAPVDDGEGGCEPGHPRAIALPDALVQDGSQGLFGRTSELGRLAGCWAEVTAGGGLRCLLLAGEPGIGKTRLLAELSRAAHADGATVLYGRCHEGALMPYAPFVEALRGYVGACSPERLRVEAGPGLGLGQIGKLVPQLAELLPDGPPGDAGDPQSERLRLFDAITALLAGASHSVPLVLALDDLHWSDRPTLHLVEHLVRTAARSSILVLGTYRDTEVTGAHALSRTLARLRRERMLEQLPVRGLEEAAVGELISASSPGNAAADLVRAVFDETEGNPFVVEEIVRDIGEAGLGSSRPVADVLAEIGVPESIQDLIGRRLARLDDLARSVVSAASVVGSEFDLDTLGLVTGVADAELVDALDEALEARVLAELPRAPGNYKFAHALVRDTLYGRLSATRRARLHGQVGRAIEQRFADCLDDHHPTLARHHELAGETAKALHHHILAGDAAVRVYAADDALDHYSRALAAAAQLGRGAEDEAVYTVHHRRAGVRQRTGDLQGALRDGEAAVAGARAAGDGTGEIEALNRCGFIRRCDDFDGATAYHHSALTVARSIGDARAQAATLARLSITHANQLRLDEAVRLGATALDMAQDAGDDAIAVALDAVKLAALQIGDLPVLEEVTSRLLELHHRVGEEWRLGWLDDWVLLERAFLAIAAANWEEAFAGVQEALDANRRLGNRFAEPVFLDAMCWIHRSRGDHARAIALGQEATGVAQRLGSAEWCAWTDATLGWAMLEAGDAGGASEHLTRGMAAAAPIGARVQLLRCTALLAWASWEVGDRDRALELAGRADALLAAASAPPGRAFLLGAHAPLAVARVRLSAGAPDRARDLIGPLLAAARAAGWRETIAYACLLAGECGVALGEDQAGTALIDESLELARLAGLRWVEREAQTKLCEVTAARR